NFTVRVTDVSTGSVDKAFSIAIADVPAANPSTASGDTASPTGGSTAPTGNNFGPSSYARAQISSDAFSSSASQCLNAYSSKWALINDSGTTNCVKVDAANDVIYGSTNDYAGWVARRTESSYLDSQYASLRIATMPADDSAGLQFVGVG